MTYQPHFSISLSSCFFRLCTVNEYGCYCQFDLFGTENSYFQFEPSLDFPNDAERIERIHSLIQERFENKILVSHDIHTKHRLVNYC